MKESIHEGIVVRTNSGVEEYPSSSIDRVSLLTDSKGSVNFMDIHLKTGICVTFNLSIANVFVKRDSKKS